MDEVDRAALHEAAFIENAKEWWLAGIEETLMKATETCIDCGEEIPPARRAVLPNICRCVECQERFEGKRK